MTLFLAKDIFDSTKFYFVILIDILLN